ncbi:Lon protease [Geodia barretti]|uniref:Lon protease n=1 Tax=Geodia barretti TaxID=519541 RepID=A0AA35WDC7_GEOBA|nr:Lon protease [Geodia barretti]
MSLVGDVLPIGGLKEKVIAAKRNRIRDIIIPRANEVDIADIPRARTARHQLPSGRHDGRGDRDRLLSGRSTRILRAMTMALAAAVTLSACAGPKERASLHAAFGVTLAELAALIEPLPESVRGRILAEPAVFLDLMAKTHNQPADLLVLVDKQHALSQDYRPPDLVDLDNRGLTVTRPSMLLRALALPDLVAMTQAARLAGTDVTISSTYRSYARQSFLFSSAVERDGLGRRRVSWRGRVTRSTSSCRGGWHGYQYEPWHFRYLGRAGTELERRFFGVQQVFLTHYRHLMPALQAGSASAENPTSLRVDRRAERGHDLAHPRKAAGRPDRLTLVGVQAAAPRSGPGSRGKGSSGTRTPTVPPPAGTRPIRLRQRARGRKNAGGVQGRLPDAHPAAPQPAPIGDQYQERAILRAALGPPDPRLGRGGGADDAVDGVTGQGSQTHDVSVTFDSRSA